MITAWLIMLCAQRMRSAEYTEWPGYSINEFFVPWWHGHIPIGLKLWKSGSGSTRHHFYTWIGHHRVQSQTLTPLRIFGMCWRRLCTAVRLSHHQYKILTKYQCNWTGINVVTLQKLIEMMPWRMHAVIKAKGGPTKYSSVWFFFLDRQCILKI